MFTARDTERGGRQKQQAGCRQMKQTATHYGFHQQSENVSSNLKDVTAVFHSVVNTEDKRSDKSFTLRDYHSITFLLRVGSFRCSSACSVRF